jgi:ABC-type lipoprotein release transport system permease subunit
MNHAFRNLVLIALRNLAQHTKRTLLLGGAIAGVTALLVMLMGLSTGMHNVMLESATTLMTGHINVAGFFKVTPGQAGPIVTRYKQVEELLRKEVPELDYITQRGRGWAKLISDTASMQVGIGGIDIRREPGFRKVIQVVSGNLDDLAQPGTLLLFEEQATKLEVKVGDTLTFSAPTPRGTNNTIDVRVVAIARNVGLLSSFNTFIPDESLRQLYQLNEDTTGALMLYLKDIKQVGKVQERLRKVLPAAGYTLMDYDPRPFFMKFQSVAREDWTGQRLDITKWEDEIAFIAWTSTVLTFLSGMLMFVLMVIISIGIMNTLWIAIRERTREIGTLRAIGMQSNQVALMFMIEAFLLSLISTLVGVVLGLLASWGLNAANVAVPKAVQLFLMSERLHLVPSGGSVVFSIAIIVICTTLVALFPSYLAARLKPVTAMHKIG